MTLRKNSEQERHTSCACAMPAKNDVHSHPFQMTFSFFEVLFYWPSHCWSFAQLWDRGVTWSIWNCVLYLTILGTAYKKPTSIICKVSLNITWEERKNVSLLCHRWKSAGIQSWEQAGRITCPFAVPTNHPRCDIQSIRTDLFRQQEPPMAFYPSPPLGKIKGGACVIVPVTIYFLK